MRMFLILTGLFVFYAIPSIQAFENDTDIIVPDGVIDCGTDFVNIVLEDEYLTTLGIDVADIEEVILVTNPTDPFNTPQGCFASRTANSYEFSLASNASECAFSFERVGDVIVYCFRVRLMFQLPVFIPIVRYIKFKWNLYCSYGNKQTIDIGPLTPVHRENRLIASDEIGSFSIAMVRNNASFTGEVALDEVVQVPDPVFVKATLTTTDNEAGLVLQATNCYATPSPYPNDTARMEIIVNNCVAPDPVSYGMNEILENFVGNTVQFRFNSFYWAHVGVPDSKIYIHCCFYVCSKNISDTCNDDGCAPLARKRDVSGQQPSLAMEKESQLTATFGPIEVKDTSKHVELVKEEKEEEIPEIVEEPKIARLAESEAICDKNQKGCSFDCGIVNTAQVVCVCPPGFGLGDDERTCFRYQPEVKNEIVSYNNDYMLPALALLLALTSYILILTTKLSNN